MRYEEPPRLTREQTDLVLSSALRAEASDPEANAALVGLAMFGDDQRYVEEWCVRIAEHAPDRRLGGLACLCIGAHVAPGSGQ
jgi:hypothetical protein